MLVLSGALDRLHLGDLLEWLHLTKATGRLLLSSSSVTRAFDIVRGKVAFASSSRASERLGSWLLRKGLASRGALLRTLPISQTRGAPFPAPPPPGGGARPAAPRGGGGGGRPRPRPLPRPSPRS